MTVRAFSSLWMGIILFLCFQPGNAQIMQSHGLSIEEGIDLNNIHVNGLDYFYLEAGEGPVIFFLHGFPDLATTWQESMLALQGEYRCIAPFLRGYYPTSIPQDGNYSAKSIALDIVQIAESMGIDQYYVVGHDWGALVAYSVANLEPEKVVKLVAVAIPHPSFISITPRTAVRARHFVRLRNEKSSFPYAEKNDMAYIDRLFRRWSPGWEEYETTRDEVLGTFRKPGRLEAALAYYWALNANSDNDSLADFTAQLPTMPLLTFAGRDDGALTMKPFKKMVGAMKTPFELRLHDDAGHFFHREQPEFFLKELKLFLETAMD